MGPHVKVGDVLPWALLRWGLREWEEALPALPTSKDQGLAGPWYFKSHSLIGTHNHGNNPKEGTALHIEAKSKCGTS